MVKVIEKQSETDSGILSEVGTGLIFIEAKWSGPARKMRLIAIQEAARLGIQKIIILDHDQCYEFQKYLEVNGYGVCHGWGDFIFVRNGLIVDLAHHLEPNQAMVMNWFVEAIQGKSQSV